MKLKRGRTVPNYHCLPYLEKMLVYVTCKFREWSLKLQRSFTWGLLLPGAYEGKSVWPLHIANSAKALTLVVCLCQTLHCWVWLCGKTQLCRPVSWSINAFNTVILWKRKKTRMGETKNCLGKIDSFALWFNCKLECTSLWNTRALFVIKKKDFITER